MFSIPAIFDLNDHCNASNSKISHYSCGKAKTEQFSKIGSLKNFHNVNMVMASLVLKVLNIFPISHYFFNISFILHFELDIEWGNLL